MTPQELLEAYSDLAEKCGLTVREVMAVHGSCMIQCAMFARDNDKREVVHDLAMHMAEMITAVLAEEPKDETVQ